MTATAAAISGHRSHLRPFLRWASVVLFCLLAFLPVSASLAADAPLQALAFRAVGDKERIRAVIEFDRKPEALEKLLLSAPHRLAIDLPETVFAFSDEPASGRGMLEAVR